MGFPAGRLRHRVRLDQRAETRDQFGGVVVSWVPLATVWAAIEPVSVREFITSEEQNSEITARIVLRSRPGLDFTLRIVHVVNGEDGKVYNPHGFLADKDSGLEYVTAPCSEGVSDGQ